MLNRRFFLMAALTFLSAACGRSKSSIRQIVVGVLSYGDKTSTAEYYESFRAYLAQSLNSVVLLEPALNEVQAVQQVSQKAWDVVISPPGLSAIAIAQSQYLPLLPQVGANQERSILIVKDSSEIRDLEQLANQSVALGHEGSATGYYFPIYNLYGLTLSEVKFAPTPTSILEWIESGEVDAGALSVGEFDALKDKVDGKFRVLFRDSHPVPAGSILLAPNQDEEFVSQFKQALEQAPLDVLEKVGFVPNASPPDYSYLIQVVKRVRPIAKRVREVPAPLF